MKKIWLILFAIFCIYSFSGRWACQQSTHKDCNEAHGADFQRTLAKVRAIIGSYKSNRIAMEQEGLEFKINLLDSHDFRLLIDSICTYKKSLMLIVKDGSTSYLKKEIALHALNFLCIDEYIPVIRMAFEEYKLGKIDASLFDLAIFGWSEMSLEVIRSYRNTQLREILEEIKSYLAKKKLKEKTKEKHIHDFIIEVLTGEAWFGLRDHYYYMHSYFFEAEGFPWYCGKEIKYE